MHQFDPGDRSGGIVPKAFEAEHDVRPRFDVAMIPVDPAFQIPGRFQRYLFRQKSVYFHLPRRTMGRCEAVERNRFWSEPLTSDRL